MENRRTSFQVSDFVEVYSQADPELRNVIKGAAPEEADALQDVIGRPLPESYRQFLFAMGRDSGWINLGADHNTSGATNIGAVTAWYRNHIAKPPLRIPQNCIAISVSGPVFNVCLEIRSTGEPRVVIAEGRAIYEEYAESLNKLLFRIGFLHYQPACSRHFVRLRSANRERLIAQVQPWAVSSGFSPLWFSDGNAFCVEKPTASIGFRQYEHGFLIATIGGASADEVTNLKQALSAQFELSELG